MEGFLRGLAKALSMVGGFLALLVLTPAIKFFSGSASPDSPEILFRGLKIVAIVFLTAAICFFGSKIWPSLRKNT